MSTAVPASPVVAAILARLTADLPMSYQHFDGQGPENPLTVVPYTVLYADGGIGEGAPLSPNRELVMTLAVRCVGDTAAQSRAGGDRVRESLDGATFTAAGRRVTTWQTQTTPVQRDDSMAPDVLFEHLLVFGLRSTL